MGKCQCLKSNGQQCTRQASSKTGQDQKYCWQHQKCIKPISTSTLPPITSSIPIPTPKPIPPSTAIKMPAKTWDELKSRYNLTGDMIDVLSKSPIGFKAYDLTLPNFMKIIEPLLWSYRKYHIPLTIASNSESKLALNIMINQSYGGLGWKPVETWDELENRYTMLDKHLWVVIGDMIIGGPTPANLLKIIPSLIKNMKTFAQKLHMDAIGKTEKMLIEISEANGGLPWKLTNNLSEWLPLHGLEKYFPDEKELKVDPTLPLMAQLEAVADQLDPVIKKMLIVSAINRDKFLAAVMYVNTIAVSH